MIAAVTVLYNPSVPVSEIVKSYIEKVDHIYLVDNSDANTYSERPANLQSNITYINNGENLGIAAALNIGCRAALKDGHRWVLTMDQDSSFIRFDPAVFTKLDSNENIALYYPTYIINGKKYVYQIVEEGQPIIVMSSGNLVNLNAYLDVDGFDDKLFIDYVDFDFCLKLKLKKYRIQEAAELILKHELGKSRLIKTPVANIMVTNHPLIRRYYITRNKLYLLKKYRNVKPFYYAERKTVLNELIKIILFENQKIRKLKTMHRGYLDFKHNIFGKKQ